MKKVLFTTPYYNHALYDYFGDNTRASFLRSTWIVRHSMGLRFLKINIPELDILEFPTWEEYRQKINTGAYDIVGFSFYTPDTYKVLEMIKYARERGVRTIWGGNYGILTPEIRKYFDEIFIGYVEKEVAKKLGKRITRVKHPTAIVYYGTPWGLKLMKQGILHTTRGCFSKCKFCQTPSFAPKAVPLPLESIENALKKYVKLQVPEVYILDENFGLLKKHTEQVIKLFQKYNIKWYGMTRASILNKNLDKWTASGMLGMSIGLENLTQANLQVLNKRELPEKMMQLLMRMNVRNLSSHIYYMIGLEDETRESILKDMNKLAALTSDFYQLCILTPFPETPLWDDLEDKFGIMNKDYRAYNAKKLVWNHPQMTPEEADEILTQSFRIVYTPLKYFRTFLKAVRRYVREFGVIGTLLYIIKSISNANISYYITKDHKII